MKTQLCTLMTAVLSLMAIAPAWAAPDRQQDQQALPESPTRIAQQQDIPVVERPGFVNTCRNSGTTAINAYLDSGQTRPLRQIQPYTRITLSGVLGTGVAQIREPVTGWVPSATLLTNCDAQPPTAGGRGQCYQPLTDLTVRSAPYGTPLTAVSTSSQVFATNPPQRQTTADGRRWLNVFYTPATSALGWIAETGTGGVGANIRACS
ncbi:MAG: hypothetical protein KME20_09585 [Kaiparowitsia implicata GSE-PSE-MK54-09C]|nr:hypothetical protein [Kaiparowitsia implicata GSE-PSE-MK54-09C]